MSISGKKLKRSCPEHEKILEQNSYDWLSNLPTDIVEHILSFLKITDAVKTSLLSRKWRYVWSSIPSLNFDFRHFRSQEHCRGLSYDECLSKFWVFVKWTIIIRDASPIYKLQFASEYFNAYQLELLICLCVMRSVQELDVLAGYGARKCPLYVGVPQSTEPVAENLSSLFDMQSFTGFGNLKTLHLVRVRFPDAVITQKLFSNCCVLENLSLEHCCFLMIKFLNISAYKLRKFNFVNVGPNWSGSMCRFEGELKLQAPNLESFCYTGPAIKLSGFSDILFLKHASIIIHCDNYKRILSLGLGAMVSGFRYVEELSISSLFAMYFSPAFGRSGRIFRPFNRLKYLKLDLVCNENNIVGLINLLKLSPNLEVLRVKLLQFWMTCDWKSSEVDVACFSRSLKEIEIELVAFHPDTPNTLELVKFFLQNGKSLRTIKIVQKKKKVNPERFYVLHEVHLASPSVTVSVVSISASGKTEVMHLIYERCGLSVQIQSKKVNVRMRRSLRIARKRSGSSS